MPKDAYEGFAERYDWMSREDPARRGFFRQLFRKYKVSNVLDCACGTGQDLIMFHRLGVSVSGSDLSDAMLAQARMNLAEAKIRIPVRKADYCELPEHYDATFDVVVCLTNAINEILSDVDGLRALRSMRSVLRTGGMLVFDQGQTDASMQDPPRFAPVVNNRDFTRLFVMSYSGNVQTVNIFDFIHTENTSDFKYASVRIKIRLLTDWTQMLHEAGFTGPRFFADWDASPYDTESSQRLICVAHK